MSRMIRLTGLPFVVALLVLSLVYIATAELGFLMALDPGNVTALWPPSGIAVAAILLFGPRLLPGVLIGSFVVNAWAMQGAYALPVSFAIACGSSLQAYVLSRVLLWRSTDSRWQTPDSATKILLFVAQSGVAALSAPTVGVSSLCLAGLASWSRFAELWSLWWLGDFAGILVFAPLLIVLGLRGARQPVSEPVLFPLCTLWFGLSLIVFFVVAQIERREQILIEHVQAQQVATRLEESVADSVAATVALQALFHSVQDVDDRTFQQFSDNLLRSHNEIFALEWMPKVAAEDKLSFEQLMQQRGTQGWQIHEPDENGNSVPVKDRANYYPIVFTYPLAGAEMMLGRDVNYDDIRQRYLSDVLERNRPLFSPPILLSRLTDNEIEQQRAITVTAPVYQQGQFLTTAIQRQNALKGYVRILLRLTSLRDVILQESGTRSLIFQILDTDAKPPILLLQSHADNDFWNEFEPARITSKIVQTEGRRWELNIYHEPKGRFASWSSGFVLLIGLLLSSVITFYIDIRRRAEIRLQNTQRFSQQLFDSSPDALLVVGQDGRILRANKRAETLLGYSVDDLQQMFVDALVPQAQRPTHKNKRDDFFRNGKDQTMAGGKALAALTAGGEEVPVEIALSPVALSDDEQGQHSAVIAALRDVSARRAAEAALRDLNATLESKVLARTAALNDEVLSRQQTEKHLAEANHELQQMQNELERRNAVLEQRNQEDTLLRELTGVIAASVDFEEAINNTLHFLPYLFPRCAGALYLAANDQSLHCAGVWPENDGAFTPSRDAISADDCWAVRRGRYYHVVNERATPCLHTDTQEHSSRNHFDYICLPLLIHGQQIGLLHLREEHGLNALPVALAASAAEQIALSLSNFQLKAALQKFNESTN